MYKDPVISTNNRERAKRLLSKRGGAVNDKEILDDLMRNKVDELP